MQNPDGTKTYSASKLALTAVLAALVTALLLGAGYVAGAARGSEQAGSSAAIADAGSNAADGAGAQLYDIELYIGHEVKGVPTLSTSDICAAVEDELGLEAYTVQEADGMYKGDAEDSTVISILQASEETKDDIVEEVPELATRLQQESILVSVETSTAELIYAE